MNIPQLAIPGLGSMVLVPALYIIRISDLLQYSFFQEIIDQPGTKLAFRTANLKIP